MRKRPIRRVGVLTIFKQGLTKNGGKRTVQTSFNACEYKF